MKNKKLALAKSLLALLLCMAMLVSTTFAWFTDSVVSGINTIAAGNLDVELYHSNAAVTNQKVTANTQLFLDLQGNPILWEPGVVSYENLRVTNEGDLALIYQMAINTANENYILDNGAQYGLSQVLKVGVVEGGITATDRDGVVASVNSWTTLANFLCDGSLLADGEETWGVVIYWQPGDNDNNWNANNGKQLSSGDALSIDLGIKLTATQEMYENDSFGNDYDVSAKDDVFPSFGGGSASTPIEVGADNRTTAAVTITIGNITATIPAGVLVEEGTDKLTLTVKTLSTSSANVVLGEDEAIRSLDVHVEGVSADNDTPITVTLPEVAPVALNMGNYNVYHVENGVTNEMTLVASNGDFDAHNQFKYDPATGDVVLYMATFSEVALTAEDAKWKGGVDHSWYVDKTSPYTIANADQLWSFSQIVGGMAEGIAQDSFEDKTITLIADIDLNDGEEANASNLIFYPIGYWNNEGTYERKDPAERTTAVDSALRNFCGTFDGNGHTIANFYHNTWEMKGDHNWYNAVTEQYYRDGMGLFGRLYKATIKNLTVDNFKSDGEIATTGVIAAYAEGSTFENIAVTRCNPRVYNIGNGGIVGCVGWYAKEEGLVTTFKNITVDNTNTISALWGSYDVPCGGILGQYYPTSGQSSANYPVNGGISFENCHVSAQMDVYNDVCANYQYYAYRYTGMLIGSVRENVTIDGHSYPKMDGITAKDCTVHFGTWNDYYYCEIIDNTTASYTHDYQMSRLTEIKAINGTTITYLDGTTGTVPASGRANYVIVDYSKGHGTENATCYHFKDGAVWTHDMGGIQTGIDENGDGQDDLKEDKQHIYLEFNNIVTGYGWGVTSKGVGDLDGVTILDREVADSVVKFEDNANIKEFATGTEVTIGELFKAASINDSKLTIKGDKVNVTVSPAYGTNSTVSATYVANTSDWTKGTLTFSGVGEAVITIQDYYFCIPTTITVTISSVSKFETKFTGDFLYRVGNTGTVALGTLFKQTGSLDIVSGSTTVDFATYAGNAFGSFTANTSDWTKGAIQFTGTGVVKVSITDNDSCTATELFLEVVDATNVTGLSGTLTGNVVLLNDCGLSSLTVSGRNTVYGNGFTATYTGLGQYLNNGINHGVVEVSDNGMLDNLRIKASIYPAAYLFYSEAQNGPKDVEGTKTRYHYQLSAVNVSGNATIQNCYIYGGRNNLQIGEGNVTIKDTVLECGTLANAQIISSNEYTVTLENLTTIQYQVNATVGDTSKTMLGAAILVGDGDKDNTSATAPTIVLNDTLKQYNWVTNADKNAVSDSNAKMIIGGAIDATQYNHTINGTTASNMGIIYLNDFGDVNLTNNTELPYTKGTVTLSISGVNVGRSVYSLKNATASQIHSDYANADRTTANALYQPQFKFDATLGGQYIEKTDDGDEFCYREGDTIKVMFPVGETRTLDLAGLVNIAKYSGQNLNLQVSSSNATVTNNTVTLSAAGTYVFTYTVTDNLFYDKNGNQIVMDPINYSWNVTVDVALKETAIPNAYFEFDSSVQKIFRSGNSNIVQFIPFLSGLKIHDYDENGTQYLRFDGGNTEKTTDYSKITSATINNVNTTGEAQGYHIVTIELEDGGKIVIDMDVRANSGSSKHSGSIKVRNNVIYVVNDGTTSGKGQTWKIYSYKFVGNNGTEINSGLITFGTSGQDCATADKPTSNFGSSSGGDSGGNTGTCLAEGTLITLADGSKTAIENLRKGDYVMSFDHLTGKVTSNKVIIVVKTQSDFYKNTFVFDDGTQLVTINEHGIYDLDLQKYVNIDHENYAEYIGHRFVSIDAKGNIGTKKLVNVISEWTTGYKYDIVTDQTLNYVAEDTLSVTHVLVDVINSFDFDENMMYDQAKMQADIEKYGLYTYDEWAEYCDISVFEEYNIPVMKVGISKGLYTKEYIISLINTFVLDDSVQII